MTILKTLVEIQNFTWIKRSNPISKGAGVHFYYNSEQFISFSSFLKDTTCELQNCFQYREAVLTINELSDNLNKVQNSIQSTSSLENLFWSQDLLV